MPYRQLRIIGANHFQDSLRGLAVDRHGHILAAGDSSLGIFNAAGALLRQWNTANQPFSVAVAPTGSVFVGETGQVEIFAGFGRLIDTWRDPERLGRITAIGFAGGSVLAADSSDRCIRRYGSSGRFLNNIGKDNRMKGFLIPNGTLDFSVGADGIIHAANPGKHRIERYTPEGKLLGHIGRFDGLDPAGFPGCCNPTNVCVAGPGHIYVTEKAPARAKVLDAAGNLVAVVAAGGFDPACKNMDLTVDPTGRVYVADTVKLHIAVFAPGEEGARS